VQLLGNSNLEEAPELSATGAAVAEELEKAYTARRPLQAAWSAAVLEREDAHEGVDDLVGDISAFLLSTPIYNRDRKHPGYRALFPEGNISFTSRPSREMLLQVRAITGYFEANPDHPAADRAQPLEAAADVLEKAVDKAIKAATQLRAAIEVERGARDAVRRVLRRHIRILRGVFDGDEAKVETLFPPMPSPKAREEDDVPTDLPPE
jgi:hypothetical protein